MHLKLGLENIHIPLLIVKNVEEANSFFFFSNLWGWCLAAENRPYKTLKRWGVWSAVPTVPTLHWHFCIGRFWLTIKAENIYGFAACFFLTSLNFFCPHRYILWEICLNCSLQKPAHSQQLQQKFLIFYCLG